MKPGNVLIGSYSDLTKVKIIDFGMAVLNKAEEKKNSIGFGTLSYMPPE